MKKRKCISLSRYEELVMNEEKLEALEYLGVDNWSGWDDAMKLFNCWQEGAEDYEEKIW